MSVAHMPEKSCLGCFKTLADGTRIAILKLLQEGEFCVGEIARRVGVTQPTISHHLSLLEDRGLVLSERKGRESIYIFNKDYPCKGCGVFTAPIKS